MTLAFSIADILQVPFGYLLDWLYEFTQSYGLALIIFAVLVKLILFPMTAKSKKSTMKMSRLTPQLEELKKKYANDQQKQNEAMRDLYKENGVSMGGGCIWSLLPLLVLLPLYTVVRQPIQYMLHETEEITKQIVAAVGIKDGAFAQLEAAAAISANPAKYADALKAAGAAARTMQGLNFHFLGGINLGDVPQFNIFGSAWAWDWAHIGLFLLPIVSAGIQVFSMFVSQKMNNSLVTDDNGVQDKETAKNSQSGKQGKMMMWIMPLMSLWIGFTLPGALSLYWFIQGVVSLVGDVYLTKRYRKIYDAEDAERLKKHMEEEAIEAEKERIRAQRREANPDGITANTSKKKLQQAKQREEEAAKAAAAREYAARKTGAAPQENTEEPSVLSGIPSRPNCRGRAYDPERYRNTEE